MSFENRKSTAGGGGDTLPVVDTTSIVKGSDDATKLVRIEADGLTTGTTRVLTPLDKNYTIGDVTGGGTASGTNTGDQDLSGLALKTYTPNVQTGTTYTLILTDQNKLVTLTNAAAITLTIPTNASVAFPTGSQVDLSQDGAGAVTVAGAGVTINSLDAKLTSNGQYVGLTLKKVGTDEWNLYGNLI